ncbi:MAG TPA: PAS domain-containing protein, partial [Aggregatilineales bacterium]|nr:PAS domain-containing protein [Aggregatilineales bacterium]
MSQQIQGEERDSSTPLIEAIFQKTPVGLLLLEGRRIRLLNPAARRLLGLSDKAEGQSLTLDGPDGSLSERIAEALVQAKGTRDLATFAYRVPLPTFRQERKVKITVLRMVENTPTANRLLIQIEETDEIPLDQSHWQEAIRHAFHEMKTPLAVF